MHKSTSFYTLFALFIILVMISCSTSPVITPTTIELIPPTETSSPTPPPLLEPSILISEVLAGVEGNNNHEFIELYNTGAEEPIDLKGWSLWYKLSENDSEKLVIRWSKHTLVPPQSHYLLVRQGEDVGVDADFSFDVPMIPQRGSLQLRLANGSVVDSLAWGDSDRNFAEGNPAGPMKTSLALERLPGGDDGNWVDSNHNAEDFFTSSPNPQNTGSGPSPKREEGLAIHVTAPDSIPPGESFSYTITVKNNTRKAIDGVTVQFPVPLSLNIITIPEKTKILDQARYWGMEQIGTESQVILWEIGLLEAGQEANTSVIVQAPWTYTKIQASNYSVQADGWLYPSFGGLVRVAVEGGTIPIGALKDLIGKDIVIEGTATMYTGGYYAGGGNVKFYIEDETGGVQIWVPDGESEVNIHIGDLVRVFGNLTVYRGALELVVNNPSDVETLAKSSQNPERSPTRLSISEAAHDSTHAGKLVQVEGIVARNEEFSYSYELDLMDDTGEIITLYVDKQTNINVEAIEIGQSYKATGILEIYDVNQELYPRKQEDLEHVYPPILTLDMDAPILVTAGENITITLTAVNYTPDVLTDLMITATLPRRGGFQLTSASEGSEINGNKILWTIPELAGNGTKVSVSYKGKVAAFQEYLTFRDYSATANEWPNPMGGEPFLIFLGDSVPIWAIQGTGDRSPYLFKQLETKGVVTGVFPELQGFWIQEIITDSDPSTSSGLFVHIGELENSVVPGNTVSVSGIVREKDQQTQLVVTNPDDIENLFIGGALPTAVPLDPPPLEIDSNIYYESLEGMLVEVKESGIAVAPTSQYGEYVLVLAKHGINRLWQGESHQNGLAIMVDDGSSIVHTDRSTLPYIINTGDQITGLMGPLAFSYGRFKIEPIVQPQVLSTKTLLPSLDIIEENAFSIMTWNVENLFDVLDPHPSSPPKPTLRDYKVSITKVANTILSAGVPTIVALQEVENIGILEDIADHELLKGFGYQAFLFEGTDSRYIDNGYLVRTNIARILEVEQHGAPEGLTGRPPLRIFVEIQTGAEPLQIHILNNHFTSMSGGESATEPRRNAQSAWNVAISNELLAKNAAAQIVILGDLNSFFDSSPLDIFRDAEFKHVFEYDPRAGWYSYIYEGVSQTLDHILVTSNLFNILQKVEVLHVNADYALPESDNESPIRKSDHDPVIAIFSLVE